MKQRQRKHRLPTCSPLVVRTYGTTPRGETHHNVRDSDKAVLKALALVRKGLSKAAAARAAKVSCSTLKNVSYGKHRRYLLERAACATN